MKKLSRVITKPVLNQQLVCNHLLTPPSGFIKFNKSDIEQSIISRFEQQVEKYPHAIAIKSNNEMFTYHQLNQNADYLAQNILKISGKKQEVIAILLEKGASYITTILSILKTGKIFVPLDNSFPIERLADIVEDSQAVLIVTNNQNLALAKKLSNHNCHLLNIDENQSDITPENIKIKISPDSPAYIVYTSGSTGKPKGVVHSHRNALHYCMNDTNTLLISPEDRVIFLYSCSALGGILCICYTLLNGASLYSFNVKELGLINLVHWLKSEEITIYHSFATLFRHFVDTLTGLESFPKIRLVKLGGEATLPRDIQLYKKYFSDHCIMYASLGSSETGTFRNFIINKNTVLEGSTVPIGYGVEDMEVILLDEIGNQVTPGEIGEIAVKSPYLALGYWRNSELTTTVFTAYSPTSNERIYRTGDMGRLTPDGCLIHMGRKDFQVKIRGFRIEVTEIEMALFQTGAFKEVVVIAREDQSEDKRLVAYIVPQRRPAPTPRELRHYLQDKIPDYMMPSNFIFLDALPLTPNGKTDRKALPAPNLTQSAVNTAYIAPRDHIEIQLTQMWEGILGVKPIGVQDNFFDLGGHSLLAVRFFSEIENLWGKQLPLATLFPDSTIEAIATKIRADLPIQPTPETSTWSSLVAIQPLGSRPPLFCMHPQGAEVLCYRNLAHHLGTDQPVYGLQPLGLDGKQAPHRRIEDMATHYIEAMKVVQPQGPYFLAGYSSGGIIAWEIAQQLQKQGETVGILAMFDTCRPGYSKRASFLQRIPIHLQNIFSKGPDYFRHKLIGWSNWGKYQLKHKYENYAKNLPIALDITAKISYTETRLDIVGANIQALKDYTFSPYSGEVTLFRTADENRTEAVGLEYDPQFGWGDIVTGGLYVHPIRGSHKSLMQEPDVQNLAEKLKVCLEQSQQKSLVNSHDQNLVAV